MIETVIIDQSKPENDPAVFVGDWCFSVTGVNDPDAPVSISIAGGITKATFVLIGEGVRRVMDYCGENGKTPFIELVQLFMKGFSDGEATIQIDK